MRLLWLKFVKHSVKLPTLHQKFAYPETYLVNACVYFIKLKLFLILKDDTQFNSLFWKRSSVHIKHSDLWKTLCLSLPTLNAAAASLFNVYQQLLSHFRITIYFFKGWIGWLHSASGKERWNCFQVRMFILPSNSRRGNFRTRSQLLGWKCIRCIYRMITQLVRNI